MAQRTFLGTLRLALLIAVLVFVALGAWLDRERSTSWDRPLRVTIYPVAGDGKPGTVECATKVDASAFDDAARFLSVQSRAYGLTLDEPTHILVSHAAHERPPSPGAQPGPLAVAIWSLRMRYWSWRVELADPLPNPRVQVFAVYHANDGGHAAPDSTGLRKGLVAVAHVFCGSGAIAGNAMVVTHELLHTLGATDKYDLASGQPLVPEGLGDPAQVPLYPQKTGEIMAGRIAEGPRIAVIPDSLAQMWVGPDTAREIGWIR